MDVETKIVDPTAKPDPVEDKAQDLEPLSPEELRTLHDAMAGQELKTQV